MTILIAGGGIAGLTAALSLHQIGVPAASSKPSPRRGRWASASTCCPTRCAN